MMTGTKPLMWEIWLVEFAYDDDPTIRKRRPAVVTPSGVSFLSFKITTAPPRAFDQFDYPLVHWQYARLDKPSTVRVSKQIMLAENDLVHMIGKLHPIDILQIQNLMSRYSNGC